MDVRPLYMGLCAGVQLDTGTWFVQERGLLQPEMGTGWLGASGHVLVDKTNFKRPQCVEHDTTMTHNHDCLSHELLTHADYCEDASMLVFMPHACCQLLWYPEASICG